MEANLNSSLQDVYNHIATVSGISSFQLVGGFPPKPLDMGSTVEKSDLADATLIQKWSCPLIIKILMLKKHILDIVNKRTWPAQLLLLESMHSVRNKHKDQYLAPVLEQILHEKFDLTRTP